MTLQERGVEVTGKKVLKASLPQDPKKKKKKGVPKKEDKEYSLTLNMKSDMKQVYGHIRAQAVGCRPVTTSYLEDMKVRCFAVQEAERRCLKQRYSVVGQALLDMFVVLGDFFETLVVDGAYRDVAETRSEYIALYLGLRELYLYMRWGSPEENYLRLTRQTDADHKFDGILPCYVYQENCKQTLKPLIEEEG